MPVFPAPVTAIVAPSLIAQVVYNPAADITLPVTSTSVSLADVDATNLVVSFVAPLSGKVNVVWSALREAPSGGNIKFGLRDASGLVAGTVQYSGHAISASANVSRTTHLFPITGLTPGTTYTYKIAAQVSTGTGNVYIGSGSGLFGHAIIQVWDAAPSYSQQLMTGVRPHKFFTRVAGDLTCNSTTWTDLPTVGTTWDITIPAQLGDVIEAGISARIANDSPDLYLDAVTIVSTAVVNHFGVGGVTGRGVQGWCGITSTSVAAGGGYRRILQAGDLSSGTVTVRLRYRTSSAVNKTLYASADMPFMFYAQNLGQAAV